MEYTFFSVNHGTIFFFLDYQSTIFFSSKIRVQFFFSKKTRTPPWLWNGRPLSIFFSNSLKICFPLLIGQPTQIFFKQTSYLIPLLPAISKPVLCHPIFQLDQFPTYIWVNATPPPSSGLVQSRFMYHPRWHLYYILRGSAWIFLHHHSLSDGRYTGPPQTQTCSDNATTGCVKTHVVWDPFDGMPSPRKKY